MQGMDAKQLARIFRSAHFKLSAPNSTQIGKDFGFEVAFSGRSNAGKSSALNAMTEQAGLARVSKTPGRTQQIVMFELDFERRLVDLPGYGFAKVPQGMKDSWGQNVEQYLLTRQALKGVVLLVDIRHPMRELDHVFLEFARARGLPCLVLLTKADKMNRGPGLQVLKQVAEVLKPYEAEVLLFSAQAQTGVEDARWRVATWLSLVAPRNQAR
jgi:GTP-binding protein